MKKQVILFIISGILMFSLFNVSALAMEDSQIEPYRWTNIRTVTSGITFNGTTGSFTASIIGVNGTSKITASAKLYYKNSSGTWIEIPKSWSYSENSDTMVIYETFTGTSGVEYKVVLDATVTKDGYDEPVSKPSTATCP